jgi:hypothetical protein
VSRFFLDTEFIEDGQTIELISIGVVSDDGHELYLCNSDCDLSRSGDWVRAHVLPHLPEKKWELRKDPWFSMMRRHKDAGHCYYLSSRQCSRAHLVRPAYGEAEIVPKPLLPWATKLDLRSHLCAFIQEHTPKGNRPEFWMYHGAYDWVVVCQLFGRMIDLPSGWPHHFMDLKQFAVMSGNERLIEQPIPKHHALQDAHWVRDAYLDCLKRDAQKMLDWVRMQEA